MTGRGSGVRSAARGPGAVRRPGSGALLWVRSGIWAGDLGAVRGPWVR